MSAVLERILGRPMMSPGEGGGEDGGTAAASEAPAGEQVRDDDAPVEGEENEEAEGEPAEGEENEEAAAKSRAAASQAQADEDEVDFGYKKFKVPKELKQVIDGFRADVTQKTQAVAEQRKALEAEAKERAQTSQERIVKAGQLAHTEGLLKQFRDLPWDAMRIENPELANHNSILWQQCRDAHQQLSQEVASLDAQEAEGRQKRALETQQATQQRIQEAQMVLHRDIPNWPDVKMKVAEFANREHGFTAQELGAIDDPRFIKLMHQAMQGHDLAQKQKTAAQQRKEPAKATETAPLVTVGAKSGGTPAKRSVVDLANKGEDISEFVSAYGKAHPDRRRSAGRH